MQNITDSYLSVYHQSVRDKVLEDAIVQVPELSVQYPLGLIEEMMLVCKYLVFVDYACVAQLYNPV